MNNYLDLLFPRFCIGCDSYIEELSDKRAYICAICSESIDVQTLQRCAFCTASTVKGKTCQFCVKNHALDQLIVALSLEQPIVKNAIHKLKYESLQLILNDLGGFIDKIFSTNFETSKYTTDSIILIPMPLHWTRKNWRGYNQAEVLLKNTNLPKIFEVNTNTLKRKYQFEHQAEIETISKRQDNARGTFYIDKDNAKKITSKNIILIDDISTTGATLDEASRVLKSYGAVEVIAVVLARGS